MGYITHILQGIHTIKFKIIKTIRFYIWNYYRFRSIANYICKSIHTPIFIFSFSAYKIKQSIFQFVFQVVKSLARGLASQICGVIDDSLIIALDCKVKLSNNRRITRQNSRVWWKSKVGRIYNFKCNIRRWFIKLCRVWIKWPAEVYLLICISTGVNTLNFKHKGVIG